MWKGILLPDMSCSQHAFVRQDIPRLESLFFQQPLICRPSTFHTGCSIILRTLQASVIPSGYPSSHQAGRNGMEQPCPPIPACCQVLWRGLALKRCSEQDALQPPLTPACCNMLHRGSKGQRLVVSWWKVRRNLEEHGQHQVPYMM